MKLVRISGLVAVLLLALTIVPAYTQRGKQGGRQDKSRQQETQRGGSVQQAERGTQRASPREEVRGGVSAAPQQHGQPARQRQQPAAARDRTQQVRPGERAQRPTQQVGRERSQPVPERAVPRPLGRSYPREVRSVQQVRGWQQQRGWQREGAWRERPTWSQHRARRWKYDHRTWVQRGGYGGYFIPVSHFSLYFGVEHYFRIGARPIIVAGYPRFHYHGYWFMLVDPWPEFWAADWYATDEVYIDYDDGYYLRNRRHPGVSLAISVVF